MKYLERGGFQNHPLMRLTLMAALVLLAGFWITNLALYFQHMSLDPASVAAYFRGDEERFLPPRSAQSLLEVTHMHLPMFAMVLLLLTHLLIFVPLPFRMRALFIVIAFGSALLSEAAGWLTRFVHPGFAWLKVTMFATFQLVLLGLLVGLGAYLVRAGTKRRQRVVERQRAHRALTR
jgi:hypothetical protein